MKNYDLIFTFYNDEQRMENENVSVSIPESIKFLCRGPFDYYSGQYSSTINYSTIVNTKKNKYWISKLPKNHCISIDEFDDLTMLIFYNLSPKTKLPICEPNELEEEVHLKDYIIFKYNAKNLLLADLTRVESYRTAHDFSIIGIQCYNWMTTDEAALKDTENSFASLGKHKSTRLSTPLYDHNFVYEIKRGKAAEAIWQQALSRVLEPYEPQFSKENLKYNINEKYEKWKAEQNKSNELYNEFLKLLGPNYKSDILLDKEHILNAISSTISNRMLFQPI